MRFRGIIIVVVCLILSILAISINPIKISDWERGNNDNFLGMVLGLDLRGGTHLVYSIISSSETSAPSFNPTKAQGVSPHFSSNLATTAASATAGC